MRTINSLALVALLAGGCVGPRNRWWRRRWRRRRRRWHRRPAGVPHPARRQQHRLARAPSRATASPPTSAAAIARSGPATLPASRTRTSWARSTRRARSPRSIRAAAALCPDESSDVFTTPTQVVGGGEQITFDTLGSRRHRRPRLRRVARAGRVRPAHRRRLLPGPRVLPGDGRRRRGLDADRDPLRPAVLVALRYRTTAIELQNGTD